MITVATVYDRREEVSLALIERPLQGFRIIERLR
jgi:hypothetical protein